jgi:serine/threonine-protein kinase
VSADKKIGQYRIVRTLGAGGMGTVYLGEHLLLGRRAAIKTLQPSLSSHREIVDRFFNEARAISAISDPGVVQVFDFGYHVDGTAYIVMEYLEGESLATRLGRLGSLRLGDALRIARQLASSLAAAHERGIIHRDLKPGNVFVIRDPEVQGGERAKILDFGICKVGVTDDASATQTGTMLGTPVYMSPEQCRGTTRVDHRADIYSLGCVLFHMACGRPPFDCETTGDYIAAHIKEPAPAPSAIAPAVPPAVDELMARCLAKDPARRFQSMAEVQQAIERALVRISDHGPSESDLVRRTTPLGEGFKSSYDVNVGDDAASLAWFVDSLDAAAISEAYEIPKQRWTWGRGLTYVCALVLGVASGLAGASHILEERAANGPTPAEAIDVATPEDIVLATRLTAHETMPPEPVDDLAVSEPVLVVPVTPPRVVPVAPPRPPKIIAARPPRASVARPTAPRPVVRKVAPAKPAPKAEPEDLYDRR